MKSKIINFITVLLLIALLTAVGSYIEYRRHHPKTEYHYGK